MKINDICKKLNISKKAIVYYEKQNLIHIPKDEKGYRVFDDSLLKELREISLYRKLSITTKDIKLILMSDCKSLVLRDIALAKKHELEKLENKYNFIDSMFDETYDDHNIEKLFNEVSDHEIKDENYILNKFIEVFPGGLGIMLAMHFSNFKFERIKNDIQKKALIDIINYLDDLEVIELPVTLMTLFEEVARPQHKEIMSHVKSAVMEDISFETIEKMKKNSDDMMHLIEKEAKDVFDMLKRGNEILNAVFSSHGYKEDVLKNIMVLSKEYKAYHQHLMLMAEKSR